MVFGKFKGDKMNKEYKELYDLVMMYVDERGKHNLDVQALEEELQTITETIEELAFDIENGKYDITFDDLESMRGDEKYHQKVDDDLERGAK